MKILKISTGEEVTFPQGATRIYTDDPWKLIGAVYVDVCPGCGDEQKGEEICVKCELFGVDQNYRRTS